MQLVDEEDDASLALFHLVEDGLQAFLKFTAEFCARDEGAHVEREDDAVLEVFRHVPAHDADR